MDTVSFIPNIRMKRMLQRLGSVPILLVIVDAVFRENLRFCRRWSSKRKA